MGSLSREWVDEPSLPNESGRGALQRTLDYVDAMAPAAAAA